MLLYGANGHAKVIVNILEELEINNKELTDEIKTIHYENERVIMRKDAEIDRLKLSLEDYKERYKEIREDNKELRRSNR